MNYGQARAYAVNVSRSGSILGLDSIENLMHELGDIQEQLKIIHGNEWKRFYRGLFRAGTHRSRIPGRQIYVPGSVRSHGSVADQSSVHEPRGVCGYHGTGEVCL